MSNISLDFLNMIKEQSVAASRKEEISSFISLSDMIAVIDTETNWHDEVMSIGLAVADAENFKCIDKRYYVFEPECLIGGIYSNVLEYRGTKGIYSERGRAMREIIAFLRERNITKLMAYNAKFDCSHLPELGDFEWYDIMRLAAYRQYNHAIPDDAQCCKTGRLKTNYGVEPIMRMLSGEKNYREVHNAIYDAVDELRIVELLGHSLEKYDCAKIN